MAIYKPSSIISDIRGMVGGNVYSRNHSGFYIKESFSPTNNQLPHQQANRTLFKYVTEKWNTLTESQRQQWIQLASQLTKNNFFGDQYHQTGYHLFMSCNRNLGLINIPLIDSPSSDGTVDYLSQFEAIYTPTPSESLTINFPGYTINNKTRFLIYATPALNLGVYSVSLQYNYIGYITESTANSFDILTLFNDYYGPVLFNKKYFFKLRAININSGFSGIPFHDSIIIPNYSGLGMAVIGETFIIN
jgi:hypothetical protein